MSYRLTVTLPDDVAEFVRAQSDNLSAYVAMVLQQEARRVRLDEYFEENELLGVTDPEWLKNYFTDMEAARATW